MKTTTKQKPRSVDIIIVKQNQNKTKTPKGWHYYSKTKPEHNKNPEGVALLYQNITTTKQKPRRVDIIIAKQNHNETKTPKG
jgi:hypothetical protein